MKQFFITFKLVVAFLIVMLVSCAKQEQKNVWTWDQESNVVAASYFSLTGGREKVLFPTEGELVLKNNSARIKFQVPMQETVEAPDMLSITFRPTAVSYEKRAGRLLLYSHEATGFVNCLLLITGTCESIEGNHKSTFSFNMGFNIDKDWSKTEEGSVSGNAVIRVETESGDRFLFNVTKLSVKEE